MYLLTDFYELFSYFNDHILDVNFISVQNTNKSSLLFQFLYFVKINILEDQNSSNRFKRLVFYIDANKFIKHNYKTF